MGLKDCPPETKGQRTPDQITGYYKARVLPRTRHLPGLRPRLLGPVGREEIRFLKWGSGWAEGGGGLAGGGQAASLPASGSLCREAPGPPGSCMWARDGTGQSPAGQSRRACPRLQQVGAFCARAPEGSAGHGMGSVPLR